MALHVNQKVVCIDAAKTHNMRKHKELIEGNVYTVRALASDGSGEPCVFLAEVPFRAVFIEGRIAMWVDNVPFRASRFRPVVERKTDISIFTAMLTPSPVTVDAMNVADHAREIVG